MQSSSSDTPLVPHSPLRLQSSSDAHGHATRPELAMPEWCGNHATLVWPRQWAWSFAGAEALYHVKLCDAAL